MTLFGSAAGPPFTPTQITGLKLWLKADALVLSNNDPVASWTDSSGLNNHATQGTAGFRPIYKTNAINTTLPVVRFDQTDDFLETPNFSLAQPCTVFVVTKFNQAFAANVTMFDGLNLLPMGVFRTSATAIGMFAPGAGPSVATTPEAFHAYSFIFNGASSEERVDGGTAGTGDPGAGGGGGFWINQYDAGGAFGGQDMAEMLAYQGLVSAGNQTLIFAYLKTKYATP